MIGAIAEPTIANAIVAMPFGRLLRAYLSEARYELVRVLRAPAFVVPFLVLPVGIYLLFGVLFARSAVEKDPAVADFLLSGFSVYAVMGPAIFGIGCLLALERDGGLMKLKRALPAPTGAYLLAKAFAAVGCGAVAMGTLVIAALIVGDISRSAVQLAAMCAVLLIGTLPFCAMGLFIGSHVSGAVAPAITNLIFLPMMWLSGLFFPLPEVLRPWAVVWPAFHLNQVALAAGGVSKFLFMPTGICVAVLVGITVLFGGLAIRRLARKG
jgi:ABC-2 type transport system permease protein